MRIMKSEIVLRKMKKIGMIENLSQMVVKVGIDIFTFTSFGCLNGHLA